MTAENREGRDPMNELVETLRARLANGLHVSDMDVRHLIATIDSLRTEVAELEKDDAQWMKMCNAYADERDRYHEALRKIAVGPFGDSSSPFTGEDIMLIARDALEPKR